MGLGLFSNALSLSELEQNGPSDQWLGGLSWEETRREEAGLSVGESRDHIWGRSISEHTKDKARAGQFQGAGKPGSPRLSETLPECQVLFSEQNGCGSSHTGSSDSQQPTGAIYHSPVRMTVVTVMPMMTVMVMMMLMKMIVFVEN